MADEVLLILKVSDSDGQGVAIKRVNGRLNVTSTGESCSAANSDAADKAFIYAKSSSRRLVVLEILSSDLFHWGACDNILSGAAKVRFIGHVREQLLEKSGITTKMLHEKSMQYGVPVEIKTVETDDPAYAALEEAHGDYNRIFIAKEKNKMFPIFKKSMGQLLQKKISIPIIAG